MNPVIEWLWCCLTYWLRSIIEARINFVFNSIVKPLCISCNLSRIKFYKLTYVIRFQIADSLSSRDAFNCAHRIRQTQYIAQTKYTGVLHKYGSKPIGSAPVMTQGLNLYAAWLDDTTRNGLEILTVRIVIRDEILPMSSRFHLFILTLRMWHLRRNRLCSQCRIYEIQK